MAKANIPEAHPLTKGRTAVTFWLPKASLARLIPGLSGIVREAITSRSLCCIIIARTQNKCRKEIYCARFAIYMQDRSPSLGFPVDGVPTRVQRPSRHNSQAPASSKKLSRRPNDSGIPES